MKIYLCDKIYIKEIDQEDQKKFDNKNLGFVINKIINNIQVIVYDDSLKQKEMIYNVDYEKVKSFALVNMKKKIEIR